MTKNQNMKRYIDKTFRSESQWVKVTRDNQNRTYTFARGHKGNFQAAEIETFSFKWIGTWSDAQNRAESVMATYA